MEQSKVPAHVAVIMDGNGRWARNIGKPRSYGHQEGLKAAKRITLAASKKGIKYLSLYVFSTENWKRAESEVSFLMQLIKLHLKKEYDFYRENLIRVIHSGDIERLPEDVRNEIREVTESTSSFSGLTVNLAINYGGRDEIIRAFNRWIGTERKSGEKTQAQISEKELRENLDQPGIPDPDLIIRTAGEQRLSNFLLWESAYSEFYFSSKYWPEWAESDLDEAIETYARRDRKFGALPKENPE